MNSSSPRLPPKWSRACAPGPRNWMFCVRRSEINWTSWGRGHHKSGHRKLGHRKLDHRRLGTDISELPTGFQSKRVVRSRLGNLASDILANYILANYGMERPSHYYHRRERLAG